MAITLPSAAEIDQYSAQSEPSEARGSGIPRIADDEATCLVRGLDTGSAAYWSQGDVDVHLLYAKQHPELGRPSALDALDALADLAPQTSLNHALRERRHLRHRLLRHGVQTTATGLLVLHPAPLVVPGRR